MVWALYTVAILMFVHRPMDTAQVQQPKPEVITIYEEIPVPVPTENKAYYKDITLTDDEWLLLGKMVHAEAGNQTSVGKRAVIEVIFNRMRSDKWPNTLTEVLTQQNPKQFTDVSHVSEEESRAQFEYIEAVLREEDPILRDDVVYFATYKANGTFYVQIGSHYFCY